jgi:hypothetical protein
MLAAGNESYGYDAAGNLISRTSEGQTNAYTWGCRGTSRAGNSAGRSCYRLCVQRRWVAGVLLLNLYGLISAGSAHLKMAAQTRGEGAGVPLLPLQGRVILACHYPPLAPCQFGG